jgi:nickel-dependent lactate racemase
METIALKYGKSKIEFKIPSKNMKGYFTPPEPTSTQSNTEIIREALAHPVGEELKFLSQGKKVNVCIEDATRPTSHLDVLRSLLEELRAAEFVRILISTGTHDANTPGNLNLKDSIENLLQEVHFGNAEVKIHNCMQSNYVYRGETTRGTPIEINAWLSGGDVLVIASDMKPHYFAGYSNPIKHILPGHATHDAVERNHSWALNEKSTFCHHPWHPDEKRRENPLAEDQLEAFTRVVGDRPVFALCMISNSGKILWAKAGEVKAVSSAGMNLVDEWLTLTLEPADALVVSPGGYPDDESLYNSQRALELTFRALKPGGKILFLSECANRIGPVFSIEHFFDKLSEPLEEIVETNREDYILYSHKAVKFAQMIQSTSYLGLYSNLKKAEVERIHLDPVETPQAIVDGWIEENPQMGIYFFDGANKLAVLKKE